MHRFVSVLAIIGLAGLAGGCDDRLARRETLTFAAGNAVAANVAMQVADPEPPGSADTHLTYSGERAACAMEKYRTGRVGARGCGPPDSGPCDTPDQTASDGSRCGLRAASERPGGKP